MEHDHSIGSMDGFLAIDTTKHRKGHTYKLITPCSMMMVELEELDAIIGNVISEMIEIHKVLMQPSIDVGCPIARTNEIVVLSLHNCW